MVSMVSGQKLKREITMKYKPFEYNLLPATDIIPGQKVNIKEIKLLIVQEHKHFNMGNQGQQPEQNESMLLLKKTKGLVK